MSIRSEITDALTELFEEDDLPVPTLSDDLVLLETELDSLGFAVLVTRLEESLGFDPFSMMDEPIYPVTFGEFVEVYERVANGSS
jgi:acyl carrier protein